MVRHMSANNNSIPADIWNETVWTEETEAPQTGAAGETLPFQTDPPTTEAAQPVMGETAASAGEPPADTGEADTETVPWISQPVGHLPTVAGVTLTNGMLLAALGVILVLLAGAVWVAWKKRAASGQSEAEQADTAPVVQAPPEHQEMSASAGIRAAYHQHIGAREDQQDSFTYSDPCRYEQQGVLAAVADGMGGLANGKAVSAALIRVFDEDFRRVPPSYRSQELLLEMAARANSQINQMLWGRERSGSTLAAVIVKQGYLHFLSVGDSRIYLYRDGGLLQLNREHIFQEELAGKVLNQEESLNRMRTDRQAHALTSYFGIGRIPALDRNDEGIKLIKGDKILLASDGVFGTLSAGQLEEALRHCPAEAVTEIGERIRSLDKPYQDNNTAVVLEYLG